MIEATNNIDEFVKEAEKAAKPPLESLFTDVYKEMPWHLQEQLDRLRRVKKEGE